MSGYLLLGSIEQRKDSRSRDISLRSLIKTGEKIMKMKDGLTKTFIFSIIILLLSGFLWGMWTYYQAVYNDCVESQTKSGVPYHQATDTCLLRLEFHNED